jgi:ATP-dependent RNA helicase DHX33
MSLNTIPEILRTNLSAVILQLLAIGIKDIHKFDFIDKPNEQNIKSAINELLLLNAMKKDNDNDDCDFKYTLTKLGLTMSKFPLDPKYSKCLIESEAYNCVEDIIKIISLLNVENIFLSNSTKQDKIKQIREKFTSSHGDHITYLNIYKAFVGSKMNKVFLFVWFDEINSNKSTSALDHSHFQLYFF